MESISIVETLQMWSNWRENQQASPIGQITQTEGLAGSAAERRIFFSR
jgi:hypothetical protein